MSSLQAECKIVEMTIIIKSNALIGGSPIASQLLCLVYFTGLNLLLIE